VLSVVYLLAAATTSVITATKRIRATKPRDRFIAAGKLLDLFVIFVADRRVISRKGAKPQRKPQRNFIHLCGFLCGFAPLRETN
jgi:hypothetical protein